MEEKAAHSVLVRCPDCKTAFMCLPELLKLKAGWLRCGACSEIFDGYQAIEEPLMRPSALKAADPPAWAALPPGSLQLAMDTALRLEGPGQAPLGPPAAAPRVTARAALLLGAETAPSSSSSPEPQESGPADPLGAEEAPPEAESDIVAQLKESLEQGAREFAQREEERQGALSPSATMKEELGRAVARAETGRLLPPPDLDVEALSREADAMARALFEEAKGGEALPTAVEDAESADAVETGESTEDREFREWAMAQRGEEPRAVEASPALGFSSALGELTPQSLRPGPLSVAGLLRARSSDHLVGSLDPIEQTSAWPAQVSQTEPTRDEGAIAGRWDRARMNSEPEEDLEFMRAPRRAWPRALLGAAASAALALSAAYAGRTEIASAAPAARPALERLCAAAGCSVGYEKREEAVALQSADLKEIQGGAKLEFRAVVISQGATALRAPGIRLEILDGSGAVMTRREFPAKAWLGREYLAPRQEAEARLQLEPLSEAAGHFKAVLIWPEG